MYRCGCSSSATTMATGRSTWDRPASSRGQLEPVAYTTLPLPSKTRASTPFSFIVDRSRAPISRYIRPRSGRSGMSSADAPAFRDVVIVESSDAQELLDVAVHDLDGVLRPHCVHHGRQRLLRVAERALV